MSDLLSLSLYWMHQRDRFHDNDLHILLVSCRQVGKNLIVPGGSRVIDARGKFVMPGSLSNTEID